MTRRLLGALALVSTLGVADAVAQESAVIVMRSGERVNAQLIDMSRQGFYVNINGTERHLNPADVAAISFVGDIAANDWNAFTEGTAVIVLRNGQWIKAELTDIGGTTPLLLTIRDAAGERELRSSDISRIIWARPANAAPPATGVTAGGGPGIVVPANQQWVSTGLSVRRGEIVTFQSTGEIRLSGDQNDVAAVTGSKGQRRTASAPLPEHLAGALIGRIGNGEPFAIGDQTRIPMPASGLLWIGINDDHVADNSGQFNVVITRRGRR